MLEIEMTEPQSRFLNLDAKFPLFVAGFGAGKSTTEIVSIFNDLSIPHKGVMKIGAYAPTYDLLSLITIPYLCEALEEMRVGFRYHGQKNIIFLENDDQIILRSMDNPGRIVGYQTFRAHIDEIDTVPKKKAEEAWNKIIARNRLKVPIYDSTGKIMMGDNGRPLLHLNRVSAYTTPEGFSFAYHRWEKDPAEGYIKVKAATYSNPHLPDDYVDSLRATYPAGLIDAYIEGDFVNLEGQNVYRKFSRDLHHTDETVIGNEIINVGMDFNVCHGAAVINVIRNDLPFAVDEIHDAYDTDDQIKILKERYPQNPINIFPDASGDGRTSSNTTESDIKKLKNAGFHIFKPNKNPLIKDRVASLNAMIFNGKEEIKYRVNTKKCPNLTNGFEQQIYGKNGLPDKEAGLDHIMDACGYYINKKFGIVKPTSKTSTTHARY